MARVGKLLRQERERRAGLFDEERAIEDEERHEDLKESIAGLKSSFFPFSRNEVVGEDSSSPEFVPEISEFESPFPPIRDNLEAVVEFQKASTDVLRRIAHEFEAQDARNDRRHLLMLMVTALGVLISLLTFAIVYSQASS